MPTANSYSFELLRHHWLKRKLNVAVGYASASFYQLFLESLWTMSFRVAFGQKGYGIRFFAYSDEKRPSWHFKEL
jgi:hypothetical protein